nr:EpsG family protein [Enterococcus alcedinis]
MSLQFIGGKRRLEVAFIILFIFAAIRGNGSGDYFTYLQYSKEIKSISDVLNTNFPMEIGFRIISFIGNKLSLNSQFVIAVMNLISLSCVYIFIKRYSKDKMLSVLLFLPLYFQLDMHAARTAVSVGIGLLGFEYIKDKKIIKFTIIVILASMFHKTALILFLLYPLVRIRLTDFTKIVISFVLLIVTTFMSLKNIVDLIYNLFPNRTIAIKLSNYVISERYGYEYSLLDPRFILLLVIFIFSLYLLENNDYIDFLLKNIIWINIVAIIFLRENTFFITRVTSYVNIYTVIAIPKMIYNYKMGIENGKMSYHTYRALTVFVYTLYVIALTMTYVPYKIFFL